MRPRPDGYTPIDGKQIPVGDLPRRCPDAIPVRDLRFLSIDHLKRDLSAIWQVANLYGN